MANPRFISTVITVAAVIGALAALVVGLFFGVKSGVSCAIGTTVGMVNLWALSRLVTIVFDGDGHGKRRARAAILLGVKSIGLFVVVGALLATGWVHALALMAGLSAVIFSMLLASVFRNDVSLVPDKEGTDA